MEKNENNAQETKEVLRGYDIEESQEYCERIEKVEEMLARELIAVGMFGGWLTGWLLSMVWLAVFRAFSVW